MKKTIFIYLLCLLTSGTITAQTITADSISIKTIAIKKLLSEADTLTSEEAYERLINYKISDQLIALLSIPSIVNYSIDSLLEHPFLGICHSEDKRLWIFSWYENNGGTFKQNLNLVQYRTSDNKPIVRYNNDPEDRTSELSPDGIWFNKIYKLKSATNDGLYLCMGSVVGCATCYAEAVTVMEIKDDRINFYYPAFAVHDEWNSYGPSYFLDSRYGDIINFSYNQKKQEIRYAYIPDDNTPIKAIDRKTKVKGTLTFDGKRFVELVK